MIKGLESVRGFSASDGGAAGVVPGAASTACALVSDWSTRVSSAACGAVVVDASAASCFAGSLRKYLLVSYTTLGKLSLIWRSLVISR